MIGGSVSRPAQNHSRDVRSHIGLRTDARSVDERERHESPTDQALSPMHASPRRRSTNGNQQQKL